MNYDNKEIIKHDLTVWATIVIVYNIVHSNFKNKDPFDIDWFYYSIASLFGLTLHSLITSNITLFIIEKFNITDYNIKLSVADTIKWTTVYIINNILFTYLKHKKIIFDDKWFKLYGGIILGYIIFNLLIRKGVFNVTDDRSEITIDSIKSMIGIFLGYFLTHGHVHADFYHSFISILIALIVYYLLIKKSIPSLLF